MNIEERAAQAAAWKATGQCNCAQAVLKAFEDKLPVEYSYVRFNNITPRK